MEGRGSKHVAAVAGDGRRRGGRGVTDVPIHAHCLGPAKCLHDCDDAVVVEGRDHFVSSVVSRGACLSIQSDMLI